MSYQIADEPQGTPLTAWVCRPNVPLLAMMLCGAWMAWPWFILNAFALGSPTKKRELTLVLVGIAGTAVMAWLTIMAAERDISLTALRFMLLAIATWKLSIANWISTLQARTFHVYEYYGGTTRNPRQIIGAGYSIRRLLLTSFENPLWIIILAGITARTIILGTDPFWSMLARGGL